MFTIGKLASRTHVSNDTLRYYEQEGLIEPAGKSPAGYRLYDNESVRRIRFIKHAQRCALRSRRFSSFSACASATRPAAAMSGLVRLRKSSRSRARFAR